MSENVFLMEHAVLERLRAARLDARWRAQAHEDWTTRARRTGRSPAVASECGFAIAAKIVENAKAGLMSLYRRRLLEG